MAHPKRNRMLPTFSTWMCSNLEFIGMKSKETAPHGLLERNDPCDSEDNDFFSASTVVTLLLDTNQWNLVLKTRLDQHSFNELITASLNSLVETFLLGKIQYLNESYPQMIYEEPEKKSMSLSSVQGSLTVNILILIQLNFKKYCPQGFKRRYNSSQTIMKIRTILSIYYLFPWYTHK